MKQFVAIIFFVLLSNAVFSQKHPPVPKPAYELQMGLQLSKFSWTIAGNLSGQNPNILSELRWRNLKGASMGIKINYPLRGKWFANLDCRYNQLLSGIVYDDDYDENNRQAITYSENFSARQGFELGASPAIGYKFITNKIVLNGTVGLQLNKQRYSMLGNEPSEADLNSSYKTTWKGIVIGVETGIVANEYFDFHLCLKQSFLRYNGTGHWNLIPEFEKPVSFIQYANAMGFEIKAGVDYKLSRGMKIGLYFNHQRLQSFKGIDKAFLTNGSSPETRFNGASAVSYNIGIVLKN